MRIDYSLYNAQLDHISEVNILFRSIDILFNNFYLFLIYISMFLNYNQMVPWLP